MTGFSDLLKTTAALLAFSAALASASPTAPPGPSVIFARSCADCADPSSFCEYAHPGAPAGHVACVRYASKAALYRRYSAAPCTDPGILAAYPAALACPQGAATYAPCDFATGPAVPPGAAASSGVCAAGCCAGAAYLQGACGTRKYCGAGGDAALIVTKGASIKCVPATGEVDGAGDGVCGGGIGGAGEAGEVAGCCFAS
ncbi:hypothetical protein DFJ74DRAFT_774897 [Hyaloraphidium curvatum]|nr:hypothetical protein DFJ74DRAFT_774897 [Hyaloraphidium curvatum]